MTESKTRTELFAALGELVEIASDMREVRSWRPWENCSPIFTDAGFGTRPMRNSSRPCGSSAVISRRQLCARGANRPNHRMHGSGGGERISEARSIPAGPVMRVVELNRSAEEFVG